jgi:hypothetical protein
MLFCAGGQGAGIIESIMNGLQGNLDGMHQLSEMASLRMQAMMDRRSKLIETLSNIMKKSSTTQDTLVQNLKAHTGSASARCSRGSCAAQDARLAVVVLSSGWRMASRKCLIRGFSGCMM